MAHLEAATEEDYKNFYETYYVPNNATLSIAGDIDIKQATKLVKKYFRGHSEGRTGGASSSDGTRANR